jgi:hypothetical protein
VKLDQNGAVLKIDRILAGLSFTRPMDVELGPDGALYVLEWGTDFGGSNPDAKLSRIEYVGNLPNVLGDYNRNASVDAADYALWRDTLGQNVDKPFAGADGSGNGTIGPEDHGVWRANFGRTFSTSAAGASQNAAVDELHGSFVSKILDEDGNALLPSLPHDSDRLNAVLPSRRASVSEPNLPVDDAILAWYQSRTESHFSNLTSVRNDDAVAADDVDLRPHEPDTIAAVFGYIGRINEHLSLFI